MRKLSLLIAILINVYSSYCQNLDKAAIYRIGDYGKLWAAFNLFHPEMAYNKINADNLFKDNISELIQNPSAVNFKIAVQKMIDQLHDPYTTIEGDNKNVSDTIQLANRPLLKWVADSIALLHFDDEFVMNNNSEFNTASLLQFIDTLKNAHGIIIDLRKTVSAKDEFAYYESGFMKQLISYLTDHNIGYPSFRTRIHYGHESETFDMSSFYYQGWFLQNGAVIKKKLHTIHKPVCLVVNRFDDTIADAIAAMQHEHIAKVVMDGNPGNFEPKGSYQMTLADSIKVNIRTTEVIYANGVKTFSPDITMYRDSFKTDDSLIHIAINFLKSKNEIKTPSAEQLQNIFVTGKVEGYDSLAYPPAPLRLLGLVRYWSAINYFCPNKDRITKNWDSVLYEYVPKLLLAKDSLDYTFTVARLITEIHDGHGWFGSRIFQSLIGNVPPVQLKYVENKTIVYKIFNDSLKNSVSPGDEIISVDNIPVKILRDSIAQYIGASNNASLQRDITHRLLAGKENTFVKINLLHNSKPLVMTLDRTKKFWEVAFMSGSGPVWKKLNDKTGYVDFGRLEVSQIDSMFNDFKNTDAIIIDDRSYPKGTVWTLINYLTDQIVIPAKGTTMIADSPDPLATTMQDYLWPIPVTFKPQYKYKGKLIILVNETTQSQAEYSCMVLQAATKKVTIIGSQTAGADGDVTGIKIPGGIQTAFSGHGIHYPDGRPTQGIGIVPDIKITPTIKGIKAGRDEVLERAVQFAKTGR
jgi:C-terminal processing protease CtpA/Prc